MARQYPVKKGIKLTKEYLGEKAREILGKAEIQGDNVISSAPGIKVIEMHTDGKFLFVTTENDGNPANSLEAIRIYNRLIEGVTGFSSKERKNKMSKL